jgi:hypothetical protein
MPEPAEPHPDDDTFVVDGLSFRDLDHDRRLAPYEDWRLPIDDRVADLVQRMTIEEKAGKTPSPLAGIVSARIAGPEPCCYVRSSVFNTTIRHRWSVSGTVVLGEDRERGRPDQTDCSGALALGGPGKVRQVDHAELVEGCVCAALQFMGFIWIAVDESNVRPAQVVAGVFVPSIIRSCSSVVECAPGLIGIPECEECPRSSSL